METNNNNIDRLQQSIQDRFVDFEYAIAIDVTKVLSASKANPFLSTPVKYFISGVAVVTAGILIWTLNTPENVVSVKMKPKQAIQIQGTSIVNHSNIAATPIQTNKTIEKAIALPRKTKISPIQNPKEDLNSIVNPTLQELPVETAPISKLTKEEHQSFDHFIEKKSTSSKDSLALFIKKK